MRMQALISLLARTSQYGIYVLLVLILVHSSTASDVYEYPVREVPLVNVPDGFIRPNFTILLFIMETGHVGSTALTQMIGSSALAVEINECFNSQRTFARTQEEEPKHLKHKYDRAAQHWKNVIDRCHGMMRLKPKATVCVMKATVNHLYTEMDFLLSIPPEDLFLVFLQRKNRVQKALSFFTAHAYSVACGGFHKSSRVVCDFPQAPLELPVEAVRILLPYLEYLDAEANDTLSTVLKPYYRYSLDYEDWSKNLTETAKRVLEDVVGELIETNSLRTSLHKMNPHRLREAVCNYEELAAELDGTPYLDMLQHGGEEGYHTELYIRRELFEAQYGNFCTVVGKVSRDHDRVVEEWLRKWNVKRGTTNDNSSKRRR